MRYKRLYLDGYNYFLTVVTYNRNPILIENIELLRESFKHAKHKFAFDVEAIVVLPDHFHMLLHIEDPKTYSKIIGVIKSYFSRHCDPKYYEHMAQTQSRIAQHYKPVWQKRFYEHTIRHEKDYALHLDYIDYNPVKHGHTDAACKRKHSSFHKFVKQGRYEENWCAFDPTIDL